MNHIHFYQYNKLPHLGQRIIKTGIAVFICLLFYWIMGFHGLITQSTVAAIICIQPYRSDSIRTSVNRIIGTLIGAGWAVLFLLVLDRLARNHIHPPIFLVYLAMSLGVIISLYSTVLTGKMEAASLAAIVFICIVAVYPDFDAPFENTLYRIVDTIVGIIVAGIVNSLSLPRRKHKDYLFFIRLQDLVPDRYSKVSTNVLVILNRLFEDGAKICISSKWAPAFMISQMGLLNVTVPVIVMDGAALYDIANRQYMNVIALDKTDARFLRELFKEMGLGYAACTIRESSLMIYRGGKINEAEKREYELMKYSPYRNYVMGEFTDEDQVCFIRIIDTNETIEMLERKLKSLLAGGRFRIVRRPQHMMEGYSGLYFFHEQASIENSQKALVGLLEEKEGKTIIPVNMTGTDQYVSENEAIALLNKVRAVYEPVWRPWKRKSKTAGTAKNL